MRYVYAIDDGAGCVLIARSADPYGALARVHSCRARLIGFVTATRQQLHELRTLLAPWSTDGRRYRIEGPVAHFCDAIAAATPAPNGEAA